MAYDAPIALDEDTIGRFARLEVSEEEGLEIFGVIQTDETAKRRVSEHIECIRDEAWRSHVIAFHRYLGQIYELRTVDVRRFLPSQIVAALWVLQDHAERGGDEDRRGGFREDG